MELLYVSSVPSEKEFFRIKDKIKENVNVTTYGMSESGFKFHTLILEGLSEDKEDQIFSLVGRSVSSKGYRGIFWGTRKETVKSNFKIKHLGLINLPFLKQLFLGISFFNNTLLWLCKNRKSTDKYIIMDSSYVTVIPFVILATFFFKCRKAAIFCDIYEYMGDVKDARDNSKLAHRIMRKMISSFYKKLDGFIVLTEQMNSVINKLNKPSIVIEGLVDVNMKDFNNELSNKNKKNVIMYAGALRKQYGLKNLVDGFMNYSDENALLWIFGQGDYSDEIKEASKIDKRIIFGGVAKNEEIVKKEIEATLLINPRPIDQEFTKYSFPSKNMEYMVSGTPILTTKLPGMPKEYYDYIYTINGNTADDITEALNKTFANSKDELHKRGLSAKTFVLNNKNNIIQTQKMIELLRG